MPLLLVVMHLLLVARRILAVFLVPVTTLEACIFFNLFAESRADTYCCNDVAFCLEVEQL